jgi:putative spermidine/putrescine transport system substrate-binding protein
MSSIKRQLSRRHILRSTGAGLATWALSPTPGHAVDATRLVVADPGGPYGPAFRKAFYDPFQQATGVTVTNVAHDSTPVAQVKAMVEAKSYLWDVVDLSPFQTALLAQLGDYLEPVALTKADAPGMLPAGMTPVSAGVDVFATVIAYRTDTMPDSGPQSWADFWDVKKFPGRRSLRRNPQVLEAALMADGVPIDQLYPLDIERGFRSLDRIRPNIAVWWSNGAQSTQLLESGEVDMIWIWNGRAQAAIDGGAPAKIVWNQGLYELDVWAIPKGCQRLALAQRFIRFASDPVRQAAVSENLAYGPANLDAFNSIPQQRATRLPTYKPNLAQMQPMNDQWWADNYAKLTDRFNSWVIG